MSTRHHPRLHAGAQIWGRRLLPLSERPSTTLVVAGLLNRSALSKAPALLGTAQGRTPTPAPLPGSPPASGLSPTPGPSAYQGPSARTRCSDDGSFAQAHLPPRVPCSTAALPSASALKDQTAGPCQPHPHAASAATRCGERPPAVGAKVLRKGWRSHARGACASSTTPLECTRPRMRDPRQTRSQSQRTVAR